MKILKALYENDKIFLPALNGNRTIFRSKKVFRSYLDENFKNWGLNKKSKSTPKTEIKIYEVIKSETLKKLFSFLSEDLNSLCLTQSQIIHFCKQYSTYLRQSSYATFFLTKKDFKKTAMADNLFVVYVNAHSDGLDVDVYNFDYDAVWYAVYRRRLVVPKND